MKYKRMLLPLLFLFPLASRADVVLEGEVNIRFRVVNLSDFPEYEFFVKYQDYYYDRGYQPGEISEVMIEEGKVQSAGDRDSRSRIYARRTDGSDTTVFVSEKMVGGRKVIRDYNAQSIVEEVRILSVEDGKVDFEVKAKYLRYGDGEEKRYGRMGVITGIELWGIDIVYFATPLLCLFGLAAFIIYRRRRRKAAA